MNKTTRLALFMAMVFQGVVRADVTSHSFFYIEPSYRSASPIKESFFRTVRVDLAENGWGGAFEVVPFGGKSTDGNEIARFFLPFGKSCIIVAEDNAPDAATRDVDARHLNIETLTDSFESQVCWCPRQTVIGAGFTFKQTLWRNCDDEAKVWFEVSFPVMRVSNSVGFKETIIGNNTGGGAVNAIGLDNAPRVGTATQAFAQSNWNYGRVIAGTEMKKTGVADVELKLWYNSFLRECCHSSWFLGVIVPTGNRPCAKFVFEPIIGNNKHVGVEWGSSIGFDCIWSCGQHVLSWKLDTASRYLFRNHQFRSFDLEDKQWGRYMETYANQSDALAAAAASNADSGTSGINVFTERVRVTPRFAGDITTAFLYKYCHFVAEAGFNLFMRQAETVRPQCNDEPTAALKDVSGLGNTTIARTIRYEFADEVILPANYAPIPVSEHNYESAAHPAVISHTVYGTIGWDFDDCRIPTVIGVGGSYDFTHANTALHRWLVWGKIGISY
ncbi:MAG: hypothetical protein WA432_04335 [Candidatus Babeliaceae bacterium]